MNRQITLATRPTGLPKESDFRLVESPVPTPCPGEILVRTLYLSVDPSCQTHVPIEPLSGLGKGWSYRWFSVHLKQPQSAALTGVPYPWSRSTQGRQTGAPIFTPQPATTSRDRGGESEHGNDGP